MTTLNELAALLDAATGPSREIDAHFHLAFDLKCSARMIFLCDEWRFQLPSGKWLPPQRTPAASSSIDAALALAERLLPGWHRGVMSNGAEWTAWLEDIEHFREQVIRDAPTAPLAILKALVAALIAQENRDAQA